VKILKLKDLYSYFNNSEDLHLELKSLQLFYNKNKQKLFLYECYDIPIFYGILPIFLMKS